MLNQMRNLKQQPNSDFQLNNYMYMKNGAAYKAAPFYFTMKLFLVY